MLPLGVLLIFGYEYATRGEGQKSNWILLRTLCYILVIIVISSITVAHLWRRAPHAKNWENSRFKYLFVENEHDLPKDENDWTPLSNSWTVTLEGIQTMRIGRRGPLCCPLAARLTAHLPATECGGGWDVDV